MSTCAQFRLHLIMNLFFKSIHELFEYNIFYMFICIVSFMCNIIELTWNKCFPSRTDDVTSGQILTAQICILIIVVTNQVMDVQCCQTTQHTFPFILYFKNLMTGVFRRLSSFDAEITLKEDAIPTQQQVRKEHDFVESLKHFAVPAN